MNYSLFYFLRNILFKKIVLFHLPRLQYGIIGVLCTDTLQKCAFGVQKLQKSKSWEGKTHKVIGHMGFLLFNYLDFAV